MHHVFPRPVLGFMALSLLLPAASSGLELRGPSALGPGDLPRIEVLTSSDAGFTMEFELPVLSVEAVTIGTREYRSVEIPGGGSVGDVGAPALPTFTRLIAVPRGAAVQITAVAEEEQELEGMLLAPMQPDEGPELVVDEAAYARDAFGDVRMASAGGPAVARNLRVVPLTLRPVDYNPARQVLRVTSRIRVEVRFEGSDATNNPKVAHRSVAPSFDQLYRELVVNYEEAAAEEGLAVAPGTWLLITQNDNAVISRVQPLVDWRKRQGFPVVHATTAETGTTSSSIKNWIQNAYDTWESPPEYIVLAGDVGGTYSMPTFYENLSGYGGEGDHPYTQLDGNDPLSDAHIGRLSFSNTTELEAIVNKIIGYETTPDMTDPGWFKRACLVGDPYDSGISTIFVQQWIKVRLRELGWTQIDTIFASPFVSQMNTALNRGDALFSYRGYYGMSGWGNSNTYALTNGWKMPFVVSITCDTGSFANGTSRSEGFLRANGGANSPKGGIGAIGTATLGTHTRFNNCVHLGICYGLLYAGSTRLGTALTRGKLELYLNYQDVEPNKVLIWSHWNNLMGDPAVDCWLDTPQALTVQAPSSVPLGANAVTIRVDEGGSPSEGAQVCLLKGTETQAVGFTDAQGSVELPVNLPAVGTMLLTVTKHDRQPHLANIQVTGAQRYVGYLASSIDDDSSGESAGNGDGLVNPGETIELAVQVKNFGLLAANGVEATLTTEDPYVTISDAEETFGDLAANGTAWSAEDFGFTVDPACPHGRLLRFGLEITSGADAWHSMIEIPVVSADLVADGTYTLAGVGDNGLLDPGETGQISIRLVNNGGAPAVVPIATMLSLSEPMDIPDGAGTYPTIPVSGSAENTSDTFSIHAAPWTPEGYAARVRIILSFSEGARDTTTLTIPVGVRSNDDPVGPDGYGYYAYDDTDVNYPDRPTYAWVELDPAYGGSGGTEVVLGDNGTYQDKSRVVDLPFAFQYYGQPFTKATICSNGWLSMGSTYLKVYRNWTIPGSGGPENLIAVFWDDLYQSGGAKVYQSYDAPNHRWIVEWSRLKNEYNGSTEVFEAILYDPAYQPTDTGDGIIVFQYHTVANVDTQDQYATVGIENADHTDGLLYTFYNRYEPGAATLAAGRAIRFVPTREVLAGLIHGTVKNDATNSPLVGATVKVLETGAEVESGQDGTYGINVAPGTYSVAASFAGFEPDTVQGASVAAGGSIQVDFSLRDVVAPQIQTTLIATTNDTIGPYLARVRISDPSPLAEAELFYRTNGGDFTPVTLANVGGQAYLASIPGQPWNTKVEYYVLARDAAGNLALDPAGAPEELFVFYVAPTLRAYGDDFETEGGWTVGGPDDGATTGLWVRVDPNAVYHEGEQVQPEDDHTTDPGSLCWVTGNAAPGSPEGVDDVDGGRTTLTSGQIQLSVEGEVFLRYYRWFSNDTGTGAGEDWWVAQISDDNGASWIDLERTKVSDRSWRFFEYDLSQYIEFTDAVRLRFIAEDVGTASIVEAAIDDVEIIFTGLPTVGVEEGEVVRFGLAQNHPNPFNPRTTIRFSLERPEAARLIIYDVQGRAVRRLLDGSLPAGRQAVVWDGRDDSGHAVPSGIYLYRLEAGARTKTRKMMLLE